MFKINKNALKCPYCEAEVSIGQKLFLNSRVSYSIRCKECGEKSKLPKWANLNYFINSLIFIIPILLLKPSQTIVYVLIGLFGLVTSIIVVFYIPLIRKDDYDK